MVNLKSSVILVKVLRESFSFAYQSIISNKIRTFLSLFGITIGIFAIISVFTIFDWLEKSIRESLATLGEDVVYIQKWPWSGGNNMPWWKYVNRPQPTEEDLNAIRQHSELTRSSAIMLGFNTTLKYEKNSISSMQVMAVTDQFEDIRSFEVEKGRYFSAYEMVSGRPMVVLGYEVANELFQDEDPIGKTIRVQGNRAQVIGVLKKEGASPIGDNSNDNLVFISLGYGKTMVNLRRIGITIMVKVKDGIPVDELNDELRGLLRTQRRLKPADEDNFSINQLSQFEDQFDTIFTSLNLAGWLIGGFSILVGGFGIANIMFVSVKERTNIIGIQKALGAKNAFILLQFLYESVLLSILGGAIGLFLVFVGTLFISGFSDFSISLTFNNILLGILVSAIIGIVSGFAPAWQASRLNPVEAINTLG